MSENEDLAAERDQLLGEVARLRVSKRTGVPVGMMSTAMTEDEAPAQAEQALAWKFAGSTPAAPPQTAAVPAYSRPGQIGRETLGLLSPDQQLAVWRQGRLENIGDQRQGHATMVSNHGP
jgi:hypothetical protein